MATVFIPTMLLPLTGGVKQVVFEAANVRQVVNGLEDRFPGMKERLIAEGKLAPNLAVAIDGEVARMGLLEKVGENSEVHFVPAIGGGISHSCQTDAWVSGWERPDLSGRLTGSLGRRRVVDE